ncbi:MFS transporter [Actinomadura fibrosa]|uniref:MFS transporter n=1 Tax=Actinomadura fibrosa TaxID=111802 RepID=A0ABW2XYJ8_9ACTN|nr:MFS transporter [Actinomadura fibrosa]
MSSSTGNAAAPPPGAARGPGRRRWVALVFICLAQLMIVLDVTIVNIALPSAQSDLGVSDGDRQWVITAYTLAFGSLLLLGGRVADYTGRRRTFAIGLAGFALASALGGAAPGFGTLLAARALQGVFAALLAPSALSLLAVNFSRTDERAKAFGIFGAIAAGGGAIGLVLGGLLTEYLDWRWCMYVNVVIAGIAACGLPVLPAEERAKDRTRFDVPGVVVAVLGLLAVVYGCSRAEEDGWDSGTVLGLLAAGAALLAVFAVVETRVAAPLLPPRVVLSRTRGGAFLAVGLGIIGMFATFLFLTYFMQVVMGYSALKAGLAFLPMTGAVLVAAGGVATRLLPKAPPRALVGPGLLIASGALAWLTTLDAGSSYAGTLLPTMMILGFGMGLVMPPAMSYATHGVGEDESGAASATVNTMQQIGGSIGTALLNTVATSATADYLATRPKSPAVLHEGLSHGFATGFGWAAAILFAAGVLILVVMNTPRPAPGTAAETAFPAHAA